MRIRVSLGVPERRGARDQLAEVCEQIGPNVGIGVLLDGDAGGRVRRDDPDDAGADSALAHGVLHLLGEIDQLLASGAADGDRFSLVRHPKPPCLGGLGE